mmetsp:Transcript_125676/g.217891  ORF Transcript_125676/g.217891 Transcript_125676/m.217891 type:complete len:207 (-) Transcript_125676:50-670(-)
MVFYKCGKVARSLPLLLIMGLLMDTVHSDLWPDGAPINGDFGNVISETCDDLGVNDCRCGIEYTCTSGCCSEGEDCVNCINDQYYRGERHSRCWKCKSDEWCGGTAENGLDSPCKNKAWAIWVPIVMSCVFCLCATVLCIVIYLFQKRKLRKAAQKKSSPGEAVPPEDPTTRSQQQEPVPVPHDMKSTYPQPQPGTVAPVHTPKDH